MDTQQVNASDLVHMVLREAFLASNAGNYSDQIREIERPLRWQTFGLGMLIISGCSFSAPLGIFLLPCLSPSLYERIMTFLIALGIGALSGSTMFFMVPQAFDLGEINDFNYHDKAGIILTALYLFFTVDRILQYGLELRRRNHAKRKVHASTIKTIMDDNPQIKVRNATEETTVSVEDEKKLRRMESIEREEREKKHLAEDIECAMMNNALVRTFSTRRRVAVMTTLDDLEYDHNNEHMERKGGDFLNTVASDLKRTFSMRSQNNVKNGDVHIPMEHSPKPKSDDELSVSIKIVEKRVLEPAALEVTSVAYMIIFGTSANNFVDGMSMGAAFSDSLLKGLSIGIAVISQQFPQELGTLAILVKSGLGVKRTLLFNLIPIILSYVGFCVGVLLDNVDDSMDDYIFAISSGMYLYIFLGTLIPEIRESTNELIKTNMRESLLVSFLQAVGISGGIFLMYKMSTMHDENVV